MGLVDYSDSDASDVEDIPVIKPTAKPSKGTFQKVFDNSNPGKIRVSLPEVASKDTTNGDEHPAKRVRTGGRGFSGFNSFLPPPKRTGQTSTGGLGGNVIGKGGLAAGVSLKTGAAPGFSKEPEDGTEIPEPNAGEFGSKDKNGSTGGGLSLTLPKASEGLSQKPAEEVKLVGKPLIFKPLSVARNSGAKKKRQTNSSTPASTTTNMNSKTTKVEIPPPRPKVSLFSVSAEPDDPILSKSNGDYQPMIYGTSVEETNNSEPPVIQADSIDDDYAELLQNATPTQIAPMPGAQSLSDIASDLNLSTADRRQLFGRQKGSRNGATPSVTKVISFNTDEEYRHNEALRAVGDQVVQKPVRAIAPGKHSLKQLINAAASQKEALEESFAKGKSNRAEASSRYGW